MEYSASCVRMPEKQTGHQSRQHSYQSCNENGKPDVGAASDQHDAYGTSGRQRTVYRQVGNIDDAERDIQSDRHDPPQHPLSGCTGK